MVCLRGEKKHHLKRSLTGCYLRLGFKIREISPIVFAKLAEVATESCLFERRRGQIYQAALQKVVHSFDEDSAFKRLLWMST